MQQRTFGKRGNSSTATNSSKILVERQSASSEITLDQIMETPRQPFFDKKEFTKFALIMGGGLIGLPVAAVAVFFMFTALQVFFYGTPAQQAEGKLRVALTRSCELAAKQTLNYPSSFQKGWGDAGPYPVEGGWDVGLEFSATNAFGVPTDFVAYCSYREEGQQFRLINVRQRF